MKVLPSELKDVLSYDPNSGHFVWLTKRNSHGGQIKIGDRAGTLKDGYIQIIYTDSQGVRHQLRAHRLAWWWMTGTLPKEIDHIDRNRANNAWSNLREVTRSQNSLNPAQRHPKNISGKTGVSWRSARQMWLARLVINRKVVFNKDFINLEDAIAARKAAELEHVGRLSPS